MAYIGAQPNKQLTKTTSQSFNGTGSATAFTLNRAVNTGEELEVFVDNVQQEPGVGKSYTATGTTLTFDEAPPSGTGNVYVIYRGQAEVTTRLEAPDLSITTAKLAASAVSTAKIADDAVTTVKITDANVTEAKLASAVGVLTEYDVWSLTSNTNFSSNDVIMTPLSRATHGMFEKIGTGMSLDSSTGYWTFPSTGFYEVGFGYTGTRTDGATSNIGIQIRTSTDSGSSWGSTLSSRDDISSSNRLTAGYGTVMLKVTNTSTHLVQFRFQTGASSGTRLNGSSTSLTTYFFFKKIKDA